MQYGQLRPPIWRLPPLQSPARKGTRTRLITWKRFAIPLPALKRQKISSILTFLQCDEEKPSCRRCRRLRQPCPGYREASTIKFKSQNEYAKQQVQIRDAWKVTRSREPRIKQPESSPQSVSSFSSSTFTSSSEALPTFPKTHSLPSKGSPLPKSIYLPPEHHATANFFTDWLLPAPPLGHFNFLPDLMNYASVMDNASVTPCLSPALTAVALASLSTKFHRPDLLAYSRVYYGRALNGVNAALRDDKTVRSDGVFVTTFLLGRYEVSCPFEKRPRKEEALISVTVDRMSLARNRRKWSGTRITAVDWRCCG